MKAMITKCVIFLSLCCFFSACNSTQKSAKAPKEKMGSEQTVEVDDVSIDLATYLRKVPGITVTGKGDNAQVYVRGAAQGGAGQNKPLFILDGSRIGNGFNSISGMVSVNDIDKVRVLKDVASTSSYGVQGAAGVIIIKTKKM